MEDTYISLLLILLALTVCGTYLFALYSALKEIKMEERISKYKSIEMVITALPTEKSLMFKLLVNRYKLERNDLVYMLMHLNTFTRLQTVHFQIFEKFFDTAKPTKNQVQKLVLRYQKMQSKEKEDFIFLLNYIRNSDPILV